MKRRIVFTLASCGLALAILACAGPRSPDAPPSATTEPLAGDGQADADARVPGLPMPQKFPDVAVWDAARATH